MPTASITIRPEIMRKIRPPRALAVPYPLGYPLGAPQARDQQMKMLRALLRLVERCKRCPRWTFSDLDSVPRYRVHVSSW